MKTRALPDEAVHEIEPAANEVTAATAARLATGGLGGGRVFDIFRRHPILAGALLGLLWGSSMRAWMRFISTNPEFSWAGTLFILGASVLAGSVLGLAWHRRRHGGAGWWRLTILSLLLLGAGGAVMWPTIILLGFAIGRRRPLWLTVPAAAAGLAFQIPVLNDALVNNWRFGDAEIAVAALWYIPMLALDAWAFSVVFAPGLADPKPGRLKQTVMIAPVVVVSLLAVVLVGGMG